MSSYKNSANATEPAKNAPLSVDGLKAYYLRKWASLQRDLLIISQ